MCDTDLQRYIESHEFLVLTVIREFLINIFLALKSSVGKETSRNFWLHFSRISRGKVSQKRRNILNESKTCDTWTLE